MKTLVHVTDEPKMMENWGNPPIILKYLIDFLDEQYLNQYLNLKNKIINHKKRPTLVPPDPPGDDSLGNLLKQIDPQNVI